MTDQATLFDPASTQPQQCSVCHAWKQPDDVKAPRCHFDIAREDYTRRPAGCLNAHDPRYAPIAF